MNTKKTIEVTRGAYGFGHDWTLVAYGKKFYLGQDAKFCSRVLGMSPAYIVQQIGSNDLRDEKVLRRLAKFICYELQLDSKTAKTLQPWELCAQ